MVAANCFLVMFDILGFKALRTHLGTQGLYDRYRRVIIPLIDHAFMPKFNYVSSESEGPMAIPDPSSRRANCLLFSDTIIFFTDDDSFASFINIVFTALEMLMSGFAIPGAPLRGSIAWGDFVTDRRGIVVGSAVEAAYVGEQSQVWAGCMLTSEASSFCEQRQYITTFHEEFARLLENVRDTSQKEKTLKASKALLRYPVPLRITNGDGITNYFTEERYVLDWTQRVYTGASEKAFIAPINNRQRAIMDNTKQFEVWARNRD